MVDKELTYKLIIIASIMSFIWVWFYNYNYTCFQIKVGRLNLMTFIAWTIGLVCVGLWWDYINKNTNWSFIKKLMITAGAWITAMMAIEWIGYNIMKIQLD